MFPVSDKSKSVLDAFINKLNELKVDIRVNSRVTKIEVQDGKVVGIRYNNNILEKADKIIIATGGLSYPATGSTGDGYKIVQELGHNITKIKPSLVPIIVADKNIETQESIKNLNIEIQ